MDFRNYTVDKRRTLSDPLLRTYSGPRKQKSKSNQIFPALGSAVKHMETSESKGENEDINVLAIRNENDGDLEYINVGKVKETEIYERTTEQTEHVVCNNYVERKDQPAVTDGETQIIVKEEYGNHKSEPFVEIFIKTEQPWSLDHIPSEPEYTECEDDICDNDTKHNNTEYSADDNHLHMCGLPGEDIASTSYNKRKKISSKGQKKSESSLLPEDQQGDCKKLEPIHILQKATNNIFNCPYCFKEICNKHNLKLHIDSVHKNNKYVCRQCQEMFLNAVNLKNHMKTVHKIIESNKMCKEVQNNKVEKCFESNESYKQFSLVGNQNIHINSVQSNVKTFVCEVCGSTFSRLRRLQKHFNIVHQGIKCYQCMECLKNFPDPSKVKLHINSVHRGIKNFECNECHKRFSVASNRNKHVRVVHRGSKNFACNHCGRMFSNSSNLKRHVDSLHIRIAKFTCDECNKKFTEFKNLKHHVDAFHAKIGNYTCKACQKRFFWLRQLKRHIKLVHEGDTR